jgi:hypothetical protein
VKASECGQARKGDGLAASWSDVTCPGCLVGRPGHAAGRPTNNLPSSDHLAGDVPHMNSPGPAAEPVTEYERQRAAEREARAPIIAERVAAAMKGRRRRR